MLEDFTAARAGLGRVGGVYQDHLATGAFSLVREARDEVGPARIQDARGALQQAPQQTTAISVPQLPHALMAAVGGDNHGSGVVSVSA